MALAEIEFELPANQYELMGYPPLHQGESLAVLFDAGVQPAAQSAARMQPSGSYPLAAYVGLVSCETVPGDDGRAAGVGGGIGWWGPPAEV